MKRYKYFNLLLILIIYMFIVDYGFALQKADSWLKRGLRASNYQEKIRCFEKAIEENPGFIEAHFNLGCVYRDIGELNKAEKSFNAALRVSPDNVDNDIKVNIIFELGKTYVKLRKNRYAKEAFLYAKNIVQDSERKCDILYELGKIYLLSEEFDQALVCLNEGIKLNPKNLASFKAAIDNAQRSMELHKNYKEGLESLQQGFYSEAVNSFSKVVQVDPNFKDAADKLYQSQIRSSRINEKLSANYNYTNADNGNRAKETEIQDSSQYRNNQNNNRSSLTTKNVKRNYQNDKLDRLYQQGLEALRNDRWRTAVSCFSSIIDENPNYRDINSRLMEAKLGMESVREMEQVAKFYNEAMARYEEGDYLKAIIEFEKAKMLYPGYKDIELKITEAKQNLKKMKSNRTQVAFPPVVEKDMPQKRSVLPLLGIISSTIFLPAVLAFFLFPTVKARFYLMQGKYKKACQLYEHVLSKKPHNTKISITLANIYLGTERRDDMALKVYQLALKNDIDPILKEKITSLIANEYLKRNIIDQNSVGVLTKALQDEMKKLNG